MKKGEEMRLSIAGCERDAKPSNFVGRDGARLSSKNTTFTFTATIALDLQSEQDLAASLNHRQACGLYAFPRMPASVKCLHLGRRVECRPARRLETRSTFTRKSSSRHHAHLCFTRACTVSSIASLTYKSIPSSCA